MTFSFHARDNGFTHVCGHRGYSLRYPENTIVAFEAAREAGATTCEIDVVLTRDDEIVVMHDMSLDRTTDGSGYVGDCDLAAVRRLRAFGRDRSLPSTTVSTLAETIDWARKAGMGLVVEMKERERPDRMSEVLLKVFEETGGFDLCLVLSFNHVDLLRLKELDGRVRTEAIVHARHVDLVGLLRACRADSVSLELDMFYPEDARALHDAGFCNRVHVPLPAKLEPHWSEAPNWRGKLTSWLRDGLIDSASGDDVPFIRRLVDENPIAR